ncbi:Uncharacterised protein [Cedecea neteri]|uniref:DUF2116 family Zn-ribbon domain-containing protein n=1 Tax=Cedecea neteri TaxID=158822 RepID=A0A291E6L2_9ENTR|nr:DUF2116 family Zn-ribbon domain-containing protein [Cedecea neteri]SQC92022.1 Uncharacterised protein [Cedecea neteri]
MKHKMNSDTGKCMMCGHPLPLQTVQKLCDRCLSVFSPVSGSRKIMRAMLMLFLVIIIGLVLEGLWATGTIAPHNWFCSSRARKSLSARKGDMDSIFRLYCSSI